MKTPSSAPPGVDRLRLILIGTIVLFVTAAGLLGTRDYLRWRHGRLGTEVMRSVATNDFRTAELALGRMHPAWVEADFLRVCRLAVWRVTDPAAVLQELQPDLTTRTASSDHLRLAVEAALRLRRLDEAARLLADLQQRRHADVETGFFTAWLAFERADFTAALPPLRDALAREPVHRGARLLRASLLLRSASYPEQVRGRAELRELSVGSDLLALDARVTYAASHRTVDTPVERAAALQAVLAHPLADHAHVLHRTDVLQSLLGAGQGLPLATVTPVVERLRAASGEDPRALEVVIFLLQESGRITEAAPLLQTLDRVSPDHANTRVLEGRQCVLETRWPEAVAALRAGIARAEATPSPPLFGLAHMLLDPARPVPAALRREAAELACGLPVENFAFWLQVRQRLLELAPDQREELIAEVRAIAQGQRRLPAAEWLLRMNAPAAVLEIVAPGDGMHGTYLAFEANLALRHFEAAAALVSVLDAVSVDGALLRARLALAHHDGSEATRCFHAGLTHARVAGASDDVLRLASGAAHLGLPDEARAAFALIGEEVLAERIRAQGESVGLWLDLTLQAGDSQQAHRIARCLATKPGMEGRGRYWVTYLDLLLNENVLAAKDAARDLLAAAPQDPGSRAVYALAQLRTGQKSAALTTLHDTGQGDSDASLPRPTRVVLAAVYAANGLSAEAERWREAAESGTNLLPEEASLFDSGPAPTNLPPRG